MVLGSIIIWVFRFVAINGFIKRQSRIFVFGDFLERSKSMYMLFYHHVACLSLVFFISLCFVFFMFLRYCDVSLFFIDHGENDFAVMFDGWEVLNCGCLLQAT